MVVLPSGDQIIVAKASTGNRKDVPRFIGRRKSFTEQTKGKIIREGEPQ